MGVIRLNINGDRQQTATAPRANEGMKKNENTGNSPNTKNRIATCIIAKEWLLKTKVQEIYKICEEKIYAREYLPEKAKSKNRGLWSLREPQLSGEHGKNTVENLGECVACRECRLVYQLLVRVCLRHILFRRKTVIVLKSWSHQVYACQPITAITQPNSQAGCVPVKVLGLPFWLQLPPSSWSFRRLHPKSFQPWQHWYHQQGHHKIG